MLVTIPATAFASLVLHTIQEHVAESPMFAGYESFYEKVTAFFRKIKEKEFDDYIFNAMGDSFIIGGVLIRMGFNHMSRYQKKSS